MLSDAVPGGWQPLQSLGAWHDSSSRQGPHWGREGGKRHSDPSSSTRHLAVVTPAQPCRPPKRPLTWPSSVWPEHGEFQKQHAGIKFARTPRGTGASCCLSSLLSLRVPLHPCLRRGAAGSLSCMPSFLCLRVSPCVPLTSGWRANFWPLSN